MSDDDHAVYVLECADGSLYTGYTTDVDRRVAEHDAGEGAKYTRGRTPVDLIHVERFESRSAALSREHEIKTLSRSRKEALVRKSPLPEDGADGDGADRDGDDRDGADGDGDDGDGADRDGDDRDGDDRDGDDGDG